MSIFSSYIVWYLFLAGLGSGCYFVAATCGLYDTIKKSDASQKLLERVQFGFMIAPCCAILGSLLLFLDLGTPDRIWLIILTPFHSIVSIGAWLLVLFIGVSGALALAGVLSRKISRGFMIGCWILGAILAVGVMLYTGLLLSDMVAIDFWYSWLLPALFIASSLSTGTAVMVGGNVLGGLKSAKAESIDKLLLALSILEALVLAAFLFDRFHFSDVARTSCEVLLFGDYAILFWLGVVLCGFAIPWFIQVFNRIAKIPALKLVSSAGVLVAGVCLRYCIVGVALYTPALLGFG